MSNITVYDERESYKNELEAKIKDIKIFCMINKIPFYACFATASMENTTVYEIAKLFPDECGLTLKEDKFRKIGLTAMGFDLQMNHVDNFDMGDIPFESFAEKSEGGKKSEEK